MDTTPPVIQCAVVSIYTQGGYGGSGTPAQILEANYLTTFPGGLVVGQYGNRNGSAAPNGLFWQPNGPGLAALRQFLSQGGGTSGYLRNDGVNSTDDLSGGELAHQAVTLTINIAFNTTGVIGIGPNNFGSLVYTQNGDTMSGFTVSQILAAANHALAGLGLPAGQSYSSLNSLLDRFNQSFHDYSVSPWAASHLSSPAVTVSCVSQIPAANPAYVRASDSCGSVSVTALPDSIQDQTCLNRLTLTRTWIATDECGNRSSCSYLIMVNDTNAPVVTCAANRTVAIGEAWTFDQPAATDGCGPATVEVLNTVTNSTGGQTFMATRTWQAIDACGNASRCEQTVTVADPRVVQDTFDSNDEGWRVASTSTSLSPICQSSGGQSGGFIAASDSVAGNNWYWIAPSCFLGDRTANYDGTLCFALRQNSTATPIMTDSIMLRGAGLTLVIDLPQAPGTNWTSYTLRLNERSGWMNALTRRAATQAEVVSVLATLTNLCIRGDYQLGSVTTGLDNVELLPPLTPPAAWVLDSRRVPSGQHRLRWPVLADGFRLEVSTSLNPPNWAPANLTPTVTNGLNEAQLPTVGAPRFYRLRK